MVNEIISIGYLGIMKCYLNVPLDEAKRRYCESEEISEEELGEDITIESFKFNDEFGAYSVWDDE